MSDQLMYNSSIDFIFHLTTRFIISPKLQICVTCVWRMFKLRAEECLNFAYSTPKYICTHTYVNKIQFGILIVNLSCTSSNLSKPKKLNYAFVCKEEQTLYCGIRPSARRSDLAFPMIQVYLVISPKTRNIKLEYTMKLLKRFMIPIQ